MLCTWTMAAVWFIMCGSIPCGFLGTQGSQPDSGTPAFDYFADSGFSLSPFISEHCDGLNDNGPHRCIYLNAWSAVGGTVWRGLGGVALVEELLLCGL